MSQELIGQRVILNAEGHEELVGKTGIIVNFESNVYGVELDEQLYLHNCGGACKNGHGWFCKESQFDLESSSPFCRLIEKDEELLEQIRKGTIVGIRVKQNGKMIMYIRDDSSKLLVFRDTDRKLLNYKCLNEAEKKLILHICEAKRIKIGYTLDDNYNFIEYSEEEEKAIIKALEEEVKPIEEILPTPEIKAMPKPEVKKDGDYIESEEELYRMLGIK